MTAPDLSSAARALICARILAAVENCFPHCTDGSIFATADGVTAWMEQALAAPGRAGFALACQGALASLRNGHTDYADRVVMTAPPFGFHARPLGDQGWMVTDSRRADLPAGRRILAVDGTPTEDVFARIAPMISASRREAGAAMALYRGWLWPVEAMLTLEDGATVPLPCPPGAALSFTAPPVSCARPDGIGVLTLPRCDPGTEAAALAAIHSLRDCRALVVDLRGNGGGTTPMALIRALHGGTIPLWQEEARLISGLDRALRDAGSAPWPAGLRMTWPVEAMEGDGDAFGGDLVFLTDPLTASAAEDLIMPFRTTGRGRVVGETTAASTGQPFVCRVDDDITIRVAAKRVLWPDGTPFEGSGIAPDIAVVPDAGDLAAGRDTVLTAALQLLQGSA